MRARPLPLSLAALTIFGAARTSDEGPATSTPTPAPSATATATVVPPPTPTAEPTAEPTASTTPPTMPSLVEPAAHRTGDAFIDGVLTAVQERDIGALRAMVRMQETECVSNLDGIGGPPRCPPGEDDGTAVSVFPVSSCEGTFLRDRDAVYFELLD